MKKLKLNLDELKVESFETTPSGFKNNGTVLGFLKETAPSAASNCDGCGGTPTQYVTCRIPTCVEGTDPSCYTNVFCD